MADDPSIPNESLLFRRIPADTNHIVWDETSRAYRISSQAFQNLQRIPPAFSVNLQCVLEELQLSPESILKDRSRYGLVALPAQLVREHQQGIERHPEPGDPSHGHVVGEKPKKIAKAFARSVVHNNEIQWVIAPPGWPWQPKG